MNASWDSLAILSHIDRDNIGGRTVLLMPLWDGSAWKTWVPDAQGSLMELKIVGVAMSGYLATEAARDDDILIPFVEFMWQRASWPAIARELRGIEEDIHLMATCAAKLEHFHAARDTIGPELLATFVNSEIEHLLIVARSTFDLFQASVAAFWNERVKLNDPELDEVRRRHKMPREFSRMVLNGENARSADELVKRYSLPADVAGMYAKHIPFFQSLRASRDKIVHLEKRPTPFSRLSAVSA